MREGWGARNRGLGVGEGTGGGRGKVKGLGEVDGKVAGHPPSHILVFPIPTVFFVHDPIFHTSCPALHEPMRPNFCASQNANTHDAKIDTLHMAKGHRGSSLWCPAYSSAPPHPPPTFPPLSCSPLPRRSPPSPPPTPPPPSPPHSPSPPCHPARPRPRELPHCHPSSSELTT